MSTLDFDRWFAGSKVVDGAGAPLVVYHGTRADFESFDPSRGELGTHFSIDPDVASGFAERDGGRVMPVYLNLKNPARIPDFGAWDVFLTIDALHAAGALTAEQSAEIREAINEGVYSDTLVHAAFTGN